MRKVFLISSSKKIDFSESYLGMVYSSFESARGIVRLVKKKYPGYKGNIYSLFLPVN